MKTLARSRLAKPLIVLVTSSFLFLSALGSTRLWDDDEGFFASTAAEMYSAKEIIVPTFNGQVFGHKPPWMYWMMMSGFSLFGTNEFGARLFSAIFGILTVLLTYLLGKRLFGEQVGFISALVLSTCLMFNVVARAATPDIYLVFFTTLSLYLYFRAAFSVEISSPLTNKFHIQPIRLKQWVPIYATMAISILVKGPIGILFPMAVMGLFTMIVRTKNAENDSRHAVARFTLGVWNTFGPCNFFRTLWWMRPVTALIVIVLVAGPWFVLVGLGTNGEFLHEFFVVHHLQRFTTPMDNHSGPIFYYVIALLLGTFPWSLFAIPVAVGCWKQQTESPENRLPFTFLFCWVVVFIGVFSLASTKLPNYILPVYPAIALLIGSFFQRLPFTNTAHSNLFRLSSCTMALTGFAVVVGFAILPTIQFEGRPLLEHYKIPEFLRRQLPGFGLLGFPLAVGGLASLVLTGRARENCRQRLSHFAFSTNLVTALIFYALLWLVLIPRVERFQSPQLLATQMQESILQNPDRKLVAFQLFRPSMVFYTRQKINVIDDVELLKAFIENQGPCLVFTSEQGLHNLKGQLDELAIIEKRPNFNKAGNVFLLSTTITPLTRTANQLDVLQRNQRKQ